MAGKTANVTARIQPDIKESAEAILEKLVYFIRQTENCHQYIYYYEANFFHVSP